MADQNETIKLQNSVNYDPILGKLVTDPSKDIARLIAQNKKMILDTIAQMAKSEGVISDLSKEIKAINAKCENLKINLRVGTQAEREAFAAYEGLEWNQIDYNQELDKYSIQRFLYENRKWTTLESPVTEDQETVSLKVISHDGKANLSGLAVGVTDNTTHSTQSLTLDANGQCQFTIARGHTYTISVTSVAGYHDLPDETFTATLDERSITMVFEAIGNDYEVVQYHISAYNNSMVNQKALQDEFVGTTVRCDIVGEASQTAIINADHIAQFEIPYGKTYTIVSPTKEGFIPIHKKTWTHEASVPTRTIAAHFIATAGSGVFAVDDNKVLYDYNTIEAMPEASRPHIAGLAINNSRLANAGAGFIYKGPVVTSSQSWTSQNIEFDTDLLPYKTSHASAILDLDGKGNTQKIIDIGETLGVTTNAATWCQKQTITFGDETTNGYLPSFGQIYALVENFAVITAFHALLGWPAPTFKSGCWWTSTQFSATNAVHLSNGSFNGNGTKPYGYATLAVFDL